MVFGGLTSQGMSEHQRAHLTSYYKHLKVFQTPLSAWCDIKTTPSKFNVVELKLSLANKTRAISYESIIHVEKYREPYWWYLREFHIPSSLHVCTAHVQTISPATPSVANPMAPRPALRERAPDLLVLVDEGDDVVSVEEAFADAEA